ncbi:MAG: preprotein translocase subunit YajC [Planctomycetota bacterium]|jgi:preprotein translocase subunit YajC
MFPFLAAEGEGGGPFSFLILLLPMILIFYLLILRPQKKQEANRKAMIAAIKKNDRILTNGGLYGVVTNVKDDEITIKVDESRDVKVRISPNFIAAVVNRKEGED